MRVLIADSDSIFSTLLSSMLKRIGFDAFHVDGGIGALEALLDISAPQIAILDYNLPELSGVEIASRLRAENLSRTYILLSVSRGGREDVGVGLDAGADDFLAKPILANELRTRMQTARKVSELQGALHYTREIVTKQATHDALTGLCNRGLYMATLDEAIQNASTGGSELAVAYLDLDNFKIINDTLGHVYGDILLKSVADRLRGVLRASDILARMGGDEFAATFSGITEAKDAVMIAERIIAALSRSYRLDDEEIYVSPSIGISIYPHDGTDAATLIKNSETAMYHAKEEGKNGCRLFGDAHPADNSQRLQIESNLRKALERNELKVYYQPRVDIRSGMMLGAEALVRWEHPEKGIIPPNVFIPLAEESGIILQITRHVLWQACRQNKKWQDMGYVPIDIAVNMSARDFRDSDMLSTIKDTLSITGLPAETLDIEITEGVIMRSIDTAVRALFDIKDLGVRISIDDFGTGYSSLSYLKRFPIDAVKIDRSFIKDITENPDDSAIAEAVLGMAHAMHLTVVAEGVETREQLGHLAELGCDEIQGFLISRPVPADEFEQFLKDPQLLKPHTQQFATGLKAA